MLQGFFAGSFGNVSDQDFSALLDYNFNQLMTEHIADTAVFRSDEFRMYAYKIKRCPRTRSHDWTECPFAHRGEKAQRRDPRRFNYSAVACPAFRNGHCPRGDFCEFAHGVFEYWLHPDRYRTRACNAGRFCQRKVCFFAHTPDQLRSETRQQLLLSAFQPRLPVAGFSSIPVVVEAPPERRLVVKRDAIPEISDLVHSMSGLKVRDTAARETDRDTGWEVSDSDLPHIGWISELLQ